MSNRLFYPQQGVLVPYNDSIIEEKVLVDFYEKAKGLLFQDNYPCVPAVKSFRDGSFMVGFYENFGSAQTWKEYREDLLFFLQEQERTKSLYLSFWAVFKAPQELNEQEFEAGFWTELSHLTSKEEREEDWPEDLCSNPHSKDFSFCLNKKELFCVGMHPQASRRGRQFFTPTIVINPVSQFLQLMEEKKFDGIVKVNRERDMKFHGSVNPMVQQHAGMWEPIQFSGKNNPSDWVCPFRFLNKGDKT